MQPSEAICRGSIALGTACGSCTRCLDELDRIADRLTCTGVTLLSCVADVCSHAKREWTCYDCREVMCETCLDDHWCLRDE